LNIVGEQLSELRDRGEAAGKDLGATLDKAYELVLLPVPRDATDAPYEFEEIDLSARLGLGRLLHDRVIEGLSNYLFDAITPEKLVGLLALGEGADQRRFVACEEVVDAAFSYLQFPKLRSAVAIRDAIARGVMKSVFGYAAMADQEDGTLRARAELVRVGRATGPEEIDLGAGAFLLSAPYARTMSETKEATNGSPGGEEGDREDQGDWDGPEKPGRTGPASGARLNVELHAGKSEIFDALRILPALADESESLEVSIKIAAKAKDKYDTTWIRNAVREPLDEAGIDGRVELIDPEGDGSTQ
jgi:hypothetical protein